MIEKLTILHINDLHSHFEAYPKIKRYFETYPQSEGELLRLDLGDNVDKWHPMTDATAGKVNVQLMNDLGIDYATIGNNEGIGLAKAEINAVYDDADFKVIINNLSDAQGRPTWAQPYAIYETVMGTKIALLAYTFPYYKTYEPNGWIVENPLVCIKRDLALPDVQAADCRILMSHLGIRFDEQIAKEIPEIDLIIGAHTHHVFEEGAEVNGTYLAAAGKYGQFVGEINLSFDKHRLSDVQIAAHETNEMPSLPQDANWIANLEEEGRQLLAQVHLADFPEDLTLAQSCQLVMDAMRDYAQADAVIINSGLVVEPFAKTITKDTLHHSLPHQMRLARLELTAHDLALICQDILSQGELLAHQEIRGMGFRGKAFGYVLMDGFAYKNGKIVYNGKVMTDDALISLVLVDQYVFARYFESIKQYPAELLFPELLREVVEGYLKKEMK